MKSREEREEVQNTASIMGEEKFERMCKKVIKVTNIRRIKRAVSES